MPEERSDNIIQQKIAGLETVPEGFVLNSAARWQQMEKILQPRKKKYFPWQYAAAALVVLLTAPFTWKMYHPQSPAVTVLRNPAKQSQVPVTVIPKTITSVTKPVAPVTRLAVVEQTVVQQPAIDTVARYEAAKQNMVSAITATVDSPATATAILLAPKKTGVTPKQVVRTRKLKVVHINELGVEEEPVYTNVFTKKIQPPIEEVPEETAPAQNNKPWWQPKPKPITTITHIQNNP